MERKGLRGALVEAALDLLDGGEEFSLRSAARRAGVSAMAPYRHFADKEALLAAVAEAGFQRLRERLLVADAAGEAGAALQAQGRAYIDFARAHPVLFRMMFSGPAKGPVPGGDTAYGVLARRVATLAPDEADAATLAAWALVHGLAVLALDRRVGVPVEAAIERALALFVDGLARRG